MTEENLGSSILSQTAKDEQRRENQNRKDREFAVEQEKIQQERAKSDKNRPVTRV